VVAARVPRLAVPGGAAVVAASLLLAWAPLPGAFVERWYTAGFYARLQPIVTGFSNHIPVACLDALLCAAAIGATLLVRRWWRRGASGWARRLAGIGWRLVVAAALVHLTFLAVWGLNYRRIPAERRARLDAAKVTPAALRHFVSEAVRAANALAAYADDDSITDRAVVERLREPFRAAERWLGTSGHTLVGRPKPSLVARTFPLAGVDGMTNPFGLEVILNPQLVPVERPFVLAHEWAHLAGHADEADASYVAWIACRHAGAADQYSAWLSLLLLGSRHLEPADRDALLDGLDPAPRAHIRRIRERLLRAQPAVREVSWRAYDQYLRANRVPEGIARYDAVLRLVLGGRRPAASPARR